MRVLVLEPGYRWKKKNTQVITGSNNPSLLEGTTL